MEYDIELLRGNVIVFHGVAYPGTVQIGEDHEHENDGIDRIFDKEFQKLERIDISGEWHGDAHGGMKTTAIDWFRALLRRTIELRASSALKVCQTAPRVIPFKD